MIFKEIFVKRMSRILRGLELNDFLKKEGQLLRSWLQKQRVPRWKNDRLLTVFPIPPILCHLSSYRHNSTPKVGACILRESSVYHNYQALFYTYFVQPYVNRYTLFYTRGKSLQHLTYEIPHYPKRFLPIRSKRFLISSKDFQRILMVTVSWLGKRTYTTLNYWNKPCSYNRIEKIFWLCDSLGSDDILFHIDCIPSSLCHSDRNLSHKTCMLFDPCNVTQKTLYYFSIFE